MSHLIAVVLAVVTNTTPAGTGEDLDEERCPGEEWFLGEDGDCHARAVSNDSPGAIRGRPPARGLEPADVILAPVRLVLIVPRLLALGVMLPIRATVEITERHRVLERYQAVALNDEKTAGIYPLAAYESGFGFGAGASLFDHDLFGHGERLTLSARFGGPYVQRYELRLTTDALLGGRVWTDARVRWESAASLLFAGIGRGAAGAGTGSEPAGEAYYAERRALSLTKAGVSVDIGRLVLRPGIMAVLNQRDFDPEPRRSGRLPIDEVYDVEALPGFGARTQTVELGMVLSASVGAVEGLRRRGLFADTFVSRVPGAVPWDYLHFGSELAWSIGLWRPDRILTLRGAYESVSGDREDIPFSELPRLGGADRLRGYSEGSFRDRHIATTTLQYDYPVHANVSGSLFVDSGGIGSDTAELMAFSGWQLGYGGGLLFGSDEGIVFRVDVAGGDGVHVYLATDFARAFHRRQEDL